MTVSSASPIHSSQWIEASLFAHDLHVVAGTDEAGRGACAGPLIAAAVALDAERVELLSEVLKSKRKRTLTLDSKSMSESERESIFEEIMRIALGIEVIIVEPGEIDRHGLQQMNESAMRRALTQLTNRVDYALTDGYAIEGLEIPSLAIWKGDAVSITVGAASIIAKVTRDRIMKEIDLSYPDYGFGRHKGYSSRAHMDAIEKHGVLDIHRRSYANIAAFLHR